MRSKLAALAAVIGLVLTGAIAPPAQAYEAGYSVYVDATSKDGLNMLQSYNNEWVGVAPGHWNMEYGNPYNPQQVNSILLRPGQCIRLYNVNAAKNGWVYKKTFVGWNNEAARWIDTTAYNKFLFGWNRVIVRNFRGTIYGSTLNPITVISLNECASE